MTIQSSGAISLSNIQTEFTGANPISLSEYYSGGAYVPLGTPNIPSSGAISLSNFYGATRFLGLWSGGSFATYIAVYGVDVSSNLCRSRANTTYGAWLTLNAGSGTFIAGTSFWEANKGIEVSSNLFRGWYSTAGAWLTYTLGSGWSGGPSGSYPTYETSSGQMRAFMSSSYGAWTWLY